MTAPGPARSSSRMQLVLILAVSVGSLAGAWLLFYVADRGGLWGTSNHGAFVEPRLTSRELAVGTAAGVPFTPDGSWWLWVVPRGECEARCRAAVHQLRQVHVRLNRDAGRVRRAIVTPAGSSPDLLAEYPRLEPLSGNLQTLLERWGEGIYLLDPVGNVVLHYRFDQVGEPLLEDLEQLLKVSQIG